MESVIPRLVESLHKRKENPIISTSELIFSFVAAFEHIPPQRQLDLFKSLANKLGPYEFLFAILIQLLDKYPDDQMVVQFAADLTGTYDATTQLQVSFFDAYRFVNYSSDSCADSRKISRCKYRHTQTETYFLTAPGVA